MTKFEHIPVLKSEVIKFIKPAKNGVFFDGTLGGGGHAEALLRQNQKSKCKNQKIKIIGVDLDIEAIKAAKKNLSKYKDQIIYIQDNFVNIKKILKKLNTKNVNGIILDLGTSIHQLTSKKRGFSFNTKTKLDMRMDQKQKLTAAIIVNEYSKEELKKIFSEFGESRFSGRIAAKIVSTRKQNPIKTTQQLIEIIKSTTPPKWRYSQAKHFATNIFRALRMVTNSELENLKKVIPEAVSILKKGSRIVVISFHSLEDRIVKNEFKRLANPCQCPPDFLECQCGKKPQIKILTRKPIIPTEVEIAQNPKARSAKLRVAEKL